MGPNCASFYILCPIPGTDQYDDFLADGLITETNLDRFDTTCLTWRHPNLSAKQLHDLLFTCYRELFSMSHFVRNMRDLNYRHPAVFRLILEAIGKTAFNRYAAWSRMHPMSGGVGSVKLDRASDFGSLRRDAYGFDFAPLPTSLQLQAEEKTVQRLSEIDVNSAV
jgi:hypothetical protein